MAPIRKSGASLLLLWVNSLKVILDVGFDTPGSIATHHSCEQKAEVNLMEK